MLDRLNLGSETADPKAFGGTVAIVVSGKVQRIEATRYAGTPVHPRRNAAVLTKVNRCMNIAGADAYAERILGGVAAIEIAPVAALLRAAVVEASTSNRGKRSDAASVSERDRSPRHDGRMNDPYDLLRSKAVKVVHPTGSTSPSTALAAERHAYRSP